jgi:glycerol-1-phosphatase
MSSIADGYEAFLLDIDGVLLRGGRAIDGAPQTVRRLRTIGAVAFMTNNSTRTPETVASVLSESGIDADAAEIATSSIATARWLVQAGVRTAFVVGEEGLRRALEEAGIEAESDDAQRVDAVVMGWDRHVTYDRFAAASLFVQRGARLVATNADSSFPAPEGVIPGAGALLSVVSTTTGTVPEVIGKPHPSLFALARARAGGGRPLCVGDRLDTDVAGAEALGWDSMLVLTGVAKRTDLAASSHRPTYVVESIAALVGTG